MLWLVGLSIALQGATAAEEAIDRRVSSVSAELIAPCCFSQTVDHHSSPQASEMKREIRDRLREGWSDDEIVDAYVAKYGERILAAPRPVGFNLLAYAAPALFLAAGALLAAVWARRHRRAPIREAVEEDPLAFASVAQRRELQDLLARQE